MFFHGQERHNLFSARDDTLSMDDSTSFFEADVFARQTGIELLEVSPGRARVKMEIREQHMNSHRTVHGGAIFTLADTAFALASNSHGVPAAAINAQISYLTAARSGDTVC